LAEQLEVDTVQTCPDSFRNSQLPQQYKTIVGERYWYPIGQRQRTALAVPLLVDAPVLILMMLSSVDNQTATDILNNLSQGTQRKTVIISQLSAAATTDRIFVMDKGIVQSGTHVKLCNNPVLPDALNQHQLEEILR